MEKKSNNPVWVLSALLQVTAVGKINNCCAHVWSVHLPLKEAKMSKWCTGKVFNKTINRFHFHLIESFLKKQKSHFSIASDLTIKHKTEMYMPACPGIWRSSHYTIFLGSARGTDAHLLSRRFYSHILHGKCETLSERIVLPEIYGLLCHRPGLYWLYSSSPLH